MAPTITDPLFRVLYNRLAEEIDKRGSVLISGGALGISEKGFGVDATATALNYQKAVAYIEALQSVTDLIVEIDHDRYGGKRNEDNGDE
jgi:hypothetical protein